MSSFGKFPGKAILFAAVWVGSIAVANLGGNAHASPSPSDSDSRWTFDFTPYFWMAGIDGHAQVGDYNTGGINVGFSQLFESLNAGLMGTFEARYGRWAGIFDGIYIDLDTDKSTNAPSGATVSSSLTQQVYGVAAMYQTVSKSDNEVDIVVGARVMSITFDATVNGGAFNGRSKGSDNSWVDGVVGVRGRYTFAERWWLTGYLDAGAGGSDFTWQAIGSLGFRISKMFGALAGYRYLDYNFDDGVVGYDLALGGAFLGVNIRF